MFCGFVEMLSSPRYCPPPLFDNVPINAPVEVTNTRNVALVLVLVASTRRVCFEPSNSARVILTVSVDGGGGAVTGFTVNVALRVTPPKLPLITALVAAVTVVVLTLKLADVAPAATVTLTGTDATALLLASVTTVAAGAAALNVTLPCTAFPPTTELADNVNADNVSGAGVGTGVGTGVGVGVGAAGVTVTATSRRPS
jgi:uncharacterized membrane protein